MTALPPDDIVERLLNVRFYQRHINGDDTECDRALTKACNELVRLRAELSALRAEREPIAWAITFDSGACHITHDPTFAEECRAVKKASVQALYAAPQAHPGEESAAIPEREEWTEVRNNTDGTLDEVVGYGCFHLEQMDNGHWWLGFGDHEIVHVNLHSRRNVPITANAMDERAPAVVAAHEAVIKRRRERGYERAAIPASDSTVPPGDGAAACNREA